MIGVAVLAVALAVAACSGRPPVLDPGGPQAARIAAYWWLNFWIAVVVLGAVLAFLVDTVDEVRQMSDWVGEAPLGVHLGSESAWRHELVDVSTCTPKSSGVAPELGRFARAQGAPQALRFLASALVEFP